MNAKRSLSFLRWISLALIFSAVIFTVYNLISYSRIRGNFPPGMRIANVSVGGLDRQKAAERLVQAYGVPIELRYNEASIQVKPAVVGFELDLENMLSAADLQRVNQPFWSGFWEYLWNQQPSAADIPLSSQMAEDRLRGFLKDEIAIRYDSPPSAAIPVAGSTNFSGGTSGLTLDVDRAVILIKDALRSPSNRVVNLSLEKVTPPRPSFQNLQILLQQIIAESFDGLAEIYLQDLQTNQELHFAVNKNEIIQPDIAFTAASTMKIPIMVSVFKSAKEPLQPSIADQITLMIDRSDNPPADRLMTDVLDANSGPLVVSQDMTALGLQNTFLGGYFYQGAPLLKRFTTPANSRTDITTTPDQYNQTTPMEMGLLLADIYECANAGGGTFSAVFQGEVSQNECRQMISFLAKNKIGVLLEAGLPDGTQFSHKHGWVTDTTDGVIHTMQDAGIVYSPNGNYVITVFLYHPVQVVFDPVNIMYAQISRAIYNYFNLPTG
jgi:beta-lactamase class A